MKEMVPLKYLAPISLNIIYFILAGTNLFLVLFSDKSTHYDVLDSSKALQLRDLLAYLITFIFISVRFEIQEKLFYLSSIFNIGFNVLIILARSIKFGDKYFVIDLLLFACYLIITYGATQNLQKKNVNLLDECNTSNEIINAAIKLDNELTKEKERLE